MVEKISLKQWRLRDLGKAGLLLLLIFLVVRYQIKLLGFGEWGDESETIVAAKMIVSGQSLYREIFNHHGPLTFLPGVVLELFGSFGVTGHRVSIAFLQILALVSLYYSPLLKGSLIRIVYTVGAATIMLVYLPDNFGHMYKYQVLAGLFLVVVLSQYTLPAILDPVPIPFGRQIIGNLLLSCIVFFSISYLPVVLLLFFASLQKNKIRIVTIIFVTGGLLNLIFLILIGSVAGYLAFHLYLNFTILPKFTGTENLWVLIGIAFSTATKNLAYFTYLLIGLAAILKLASFESNIPWRSSLVALALGSLLIRGPEYHALPYLYALTSLPLVFLYGKKVIQTKWVPAALSFLLVCFIKLSLLIPADAQKLMSGKRFEKTEFGQLAKFLTDENDLIIAYSFRSFSYIAANRLPASGNYFYLPWQEEYKNNPVLGIEIDACKDIKSYRPKLMALDKWKVLDRYSWASYGTCIQDFADQNYTQFPARPYYIRNDLAPEFLGLDADGLPKTLRPSVGLTPKNSIQILFTPKHLKSNNQLTKIGIMFATYLKTNQGEAELQLINKDGSTSKIKFSLPALVDNGYFYFDVKNGQYTTGQIISLSGEGISTWESAGKAGGATTCVMYQYQDGTLKHTPGCTIP
ncbi:MAG: hypothetical protein JKY46_10225 [Robiginitomaculum sp.]|nr:hypothetical protein [Robiginitomaculum sp.]